MTILDQLRITWAWFTATSFGQMCLSFVRVFTATLAGAWISAGTPTSGISSADLSDWLSVALSAGVALVVANYIGPWEKRYGRKSKRG